MLTTRILEEILARIGGLTIGVLGDLFLDRYLDLDSSLTEPSLETGLDAYQVVHVRAQPGAAGTILNNLIALGVGRALPVAFVGDDGEGYELDQALRALPRVEMWGVLRDGRRRTPTYTKPMLCSADGTRRELHRLDIKNRIPLPKDLEARLIEALGAVWPQVDALVVLDQVSEADCGVVTTRVRQHLAELGEADPAKLILADSRERAGLFRAVTLKPNRAECLRAVPATGPGRLEARAAELSRRSGRPIFCTCGKKGIWVAAGTGGGTLVPAYPVNGAIDIVGAGDSTSAGIACAMAAGAALTEAAAFGNLVASITIQQIGTTGTATPAQVRQRWRDIGQ